MVLLFDVNGTLLDIAALAQPLRKLFGSKLPVDHFFTQLLQYSTATTLAGQYHDLAELAQATLHMHAAAENLQLTSKQVQTVLISMRRLPAFPDVQPALQRFRNAGFRLAVLTNSNSAALQEQLQRSKLAGYFEQALSVDSVRKYKPAAETYKYAAHSLSVEPHDIVMVASHPWDLLGAASAGCQTAFIQRPGRAWFPTIAPPDYTAANLSAFADHLLGVESQPEPAPIPKPTNYGVLASCATALGLATVLLSVTTEPER